MPSPHIGAEAITPVISATGRIQGNSAIPVYVYTSIPADRRGLGMAAQPVVFINDSDFVENGGQYKLQGRLTALPVIQMPAGSRAIGTPAIPVYDVTNKAWPPAFNPVVPTPPSSFPPITTGLQLDLQADASEIASLNDSDPIPATWHDTSGLHHDFTRGAGSTGLTKGTDGDGKPYVLFNDINDWMDGSNFADNFDSATIFAVVEALEQLVNGSHVIGKINIAVTGQGWQAWLPDTIGVPTDTKGAYQTQDTGGTNNWIMETDTHPGPLGKLVVTYNVLTRSSGTIYFNGTDALADVFNFGVPASFSNALNVTIGADAGFAEFQHMKLYALMMYIPALSPADRQTMEAALKTKYGTP